MKVDFLTTNNRNNGYGMTREYFKKYLPKYGVELDAPYAGNEVALILNLPPAVDLTHAPIKVLYTMLEGDEVPESWKPFLDTLNHIIVPTTFVQQTFARAGYKTTVIPLGYDQKVFKKVEREEDEVYTFMMYEAFQDRKGWQELLEAWLLSGLAEEEEKCRLVLKSIKTPSEILRKIHDRHLFVPHNVKFIIGELPHHAIFDLLSEADCFVFPSRGEGFSLPPIEAMATGLPVILTKGHSHADYYNGNYMYGIDSKIKIPARYHNWEDQGNFVRCNINDLAEMLKHVYENKAEAKRIGQNSVEYVKKYRYSRVIKKLANYLCQLKR